MAHSIESVPDDESDSRIRDVWNAPDEIAHHTPGGTPARTETVTVGDGC